MFVLNITFPRRKTGEFSREEAQSEASWFECELDMREPANFGKSSASSGDDSQTLHHLDQPQPHILSMLQGLCRTLTC